MTVTLSFVFEQNKSGWIKMLCQQIYPWIEEWNMNFHVFSATVKNRVVSNGQIKGSLRYLQSNIKPNFASFI